MVATRPVDFRKGADGQAALVRESLGADPFNGAIYVFLVCGTPPWPDAIAPLSLAMRGLG